MLESIVQNEDVSKFPLFRLETGFISIGSHNHWNVAQTTFHQKWLVAGFFPIRTNHKHIATRPAVAAR